jgi:hypothetical protein
VRIARLLRAADPDAAEAVLRSYLKEELTPRHRESPAGTLASAGFGALVDAD